MTPYSQHVGSKQSEPSHLRPTAGSGSLGAGVLLSVSLHGLLIAVVIFGLPIFWEPEPLPQAIGIELAQLSDITAAPVVQKEGKPNKQPTPQPEVKKEEPKQETPPPPPNPPPAAAPPPPPPPEEEVAEAIPDPAAERQKEADKKKEEEAKKKAEDEKKKKEQEKKKKEDEKKKQQKKDDEALKGLLQNVLAQKPAPEPDKKPDKKKVEPKPAEPSTGPKTDNASDIPLTATQENGFRHQLIPYWNFDAGIANPENYIVTVRIDLAPDGTVLRAEILDKSRMGDPVFRSVAETALRAPLKLGRFELAPGEPVPPQVDIVFDLAKAINGSF